MENQTQQIVRFINLNLTAWNAARLPLSNSSRDNTSSFWKSFISVCLSYTLCVCVCVCILSCFSCVQLFATPWTIAYQAALSMGILQARILEWVAMPSSRGSSWSKDQTWVSCIGRQVPYHQHHLGSPLYTLTHVFIKLTLCTKFSHPGFQRLHLSNHRQIISLPFKRWITAP